MYVGERKIDILKIYISLANCVYYIEMPSNDCKLLCFQKEKQLNIASEKWERKNRRVYLLTFYLIVTQKIIAENIKYFGTNTNDNYRLLFFPLNSKRLIK